MLNGDCEYDLPLFTIASISATSIDGLSRLIHVSIIIHARDSSTHKGFVKDVAVTRFYFTLCVNQHTQCGMKVQIQ